MFLAVCVGVWVLFRYFTLVDALAPPATPENQHAILTIHVCGTCMRQQMPRVHSTDVEGSTLQRSCPTTRQRLHRRHPPGPRQKQRQHTHTATPTADQPRPVRARSRRCLPTRPARHHKARKRLKSNTNTCSSPKNAPTTSAPRRHPTEHRSCVRCPDLRAPSTAAHAYARAASGRDSNVSGHHHSTPTGLFKSTTLAAPHGSQVVRML